MNGFRMCLFLNQILHVFRTPKTDLIKMIGDLPDIVEHNTIYITGEKGRWTYLTMKCPCGCGDIIELNLNSNYRPRWMVTWHGNGNISISPSINRSKKCRSHFFYTKGKVLWCQPK